MYSKLPKYYHKLGFGTFASVFHKESLPLIMGFIQTRGIIKSQCKIIDLACGTGVLCHVLSKDGYKVSGLDVSKEMLTIARKKNLRLKFFHKDLRKFTLKPRFHIATCSFDSLNHIMENAELIAAFKNVSNCLEKKGLFIFDINMPLGLMGWRHSSTISGKDYLIHRAGSYNETSRIAQIAIEAFVKTRGKYYDRIYEQFYQKGYPTPVIRKMLKQAGFNKIVIRDFHRGRSLNEARRIFVAAYK